VKLSNLLSRGMKPQGFLRELFLFLVCASGVYVVTSTNGFPAFQASIVSIFIAILYLVSIFLTFLTFIRTGVYKATIFVFLFIVSFFWIYFYLKSSSGGVIFLSGDVIEGEGSVEAWFQIELIKRLLAIGIFMIVLRCLLAGVSSKKEL
jgi:hypothetical protein